jgi:hypothetical protein
MVGKFALILLLIGLLASPAQAQPGITIAVNNAVLEYPQEIQFRLTARSLSPIDAVYLLYGTNARSCSQQFGRQAVALAPAGLQSVEWAWDLVEHSDIVPPGAKVWWQWEIHNQAGEVFVSEKQTLPIEDPNFKWRTLQSGDLTVDWIIGDDRFGKFLIETAQRSLDRLAQKAGVRPEGNLRLIVYPDAKTFHESIPGLPDWAGGVAFAEYGSVIMIIPAGSTTWGSSVIPHELAHLVTDEQTHNCLGVSMPTWLSEGLSVFAEGEQSQRDVKRLEQALQDEKAPSLRSLSAGFIGDETLAALNYILSGYAVNYLIETYGADKLSAMLGELRSGQTIDQSMEQVYGFNVDSLDREWRAALGHPLAEAGAAAPPLVSTVIPTLALWTPPFRPATSTPTASPTPPAALAPTFTHTPQPETSSPPTPPATPTANLPARTVALPVLAGCLAAASLIGVLTALAAYWLLKVRQ